MTIAMPDSIIPANLPGGYRAYLGYVDGFWPTAGALRSKFPSAHIVTLTVKGGSAVATGCDIENGDLTPASGAAWLKGRIEAGQMLPVGYASASEMFAVLAELAKAGVARSQVRLVSAHYGTGEHICGPSTCEYSQGGQVIPAMDGTQWTDVFPGVNGASIDMYSLNDGFFGATAPGTYTWTEFDMAKLPVLAQGASDQSGGGFWYVHRMQELVKLSGGLLGVPAAAGITVDGSFGPATRAAVEGVQAHYRASNASVSVDGKCGQQTWGLLLTGAA